MVRNENIHDLILFLCGPGIPFQVTIYTHTADTNFNMTNFYTEIID